MAAAAPTDPETRLGSVADRPSPISSPIVESSKATSVQHLAERASTPTSPDPALDHPQQVDEDGIPSSKQHVHHDVPQAEDVNRIDVDSAPEQGQPQAAEQELTLPLAQNQKPALSTPVSLNEKQPPLSDAAFAADHQPATPMVSIPAHGHHHASTQKPKHGLHRQASLSSIGSPPQASRLGDPFPGPSRRSSSNLQPRQPARKSSRSSNRQPPTNPRQVVTSVLESLHRNLQNIDKSVFEDTQTLSEQDALKLSLSICDVPYDGGESTRNWWHPSSDIPTAFEHLEPQPKHVIRIFNYTFEIGWIQPEYQDLIRVCLDQHISGAYGTSINLRSMIWPDTDDDGVDGPASDIDVLTPYH